MKYGKLTLGQIEALINNLGGRYAVERILRHGSIAHAIARLTDPTYHPYPVTIDYNLSIWQMIDAGRYDRMDNNVAIPELTTTGMTLVDVDLELHQFDRVISLDRVPKRLIHFGFQPAGVVELLAFGTKYPDIQREFQIIAVEDFITTLDGHRFVPYLDGSARERSLRFCPIRRFCTKDCRFLVVRQ